MLPKERLQYARVMITGVVQNQHQAAATSPVAQEFAEEVTKGQAVEFGILPGDQLSVTQIDRAKQGHRLSGGSVQQHGVGLLWGNPHARAGAVLLEMAFVQTPPIKAGVAGETAEFFYIEPARPGRRGR